MQSMNYMLCGGGWLAILVLVVSTVYAAKGNSTSGNKLFLTYCFICHGSGGTGNGPAAPDLPTKPRNLTDDAYMSAHSDQHLYGAISGGGAAFHGSLAMPQWGNLLTEEQIWDLVAYVRTLHRKPFLHSDVTRGGRLFSQYCWVCHGKGGHGDGPIAFVYSPRPRDLTDKGYLATRTDNDLYNAISQGGPAVNRSVAMPAWGGKLTPQEIWDLVVYIRKLSTE